MKSGEPNGLMKNGSFSGVKQTPKNILKNIGEIKKLLGKSGNPNFEGFLPKGIAEAIQIPENPTERQLKDVLERTDEIKASLQLRSLTDRPTPTPDQVSAEIKKLTDERKKLQKEEESSSSFWRLFSLKKEQEYQAIKHKISEIDEKIAELTGNQGNIKSLNITKTAAEIKKARVANNDSILDMIGKERADNVQKIETWTANEREFNRKLAETPNGHERRLLLLQLQALKVEKEAEKANTRQRRLDEARKMEGVRKYTQPVLEQMKKMGDIRFWQKVAVYGGIGLLAGTLIAAPVAAAAAGTLVATGAKLAVAKVVAGALAGSISGSVTSAAKFYHDKEFDGSAGDKETYKSRMKTAALIGALTGGIGGAYAEEIKSFFHGIYDLLANTISTPVPTVTLSETLSPVTQYPAHAVTEVTPHAVEPTPSVVTPPVATSPAAQYLAQVPTGDIPTTAINTTTAPVVPDLQAQYPAHAVTEVTPHAVEPTPSVVTPPVVPDTGASVPIAPAPIAPEKIVDLIGTTGLEGSGLKYFTGHGMTPAQANNFLENLFGFDDSRAKVVEMLQQVAEKTGKPIPNKIIDRLLEQDSAGAFWKTLNSIKVPESTFNQFFEIVKGIGEETNATITRNGVKITGNLFELAKQIK